MKTQNKNINKLKPYEKLAGFYKDEWDKFSLEYLKVIENIREQYKFQPHTIIDFACGTGNLANSLHERGYRVVGVDLSNEMIDVAKKNNPEIEYFTGDMCDISLQVKAGLITCTFDSINYLPEETFVNKFFANVYKHLEIDGYFLFDTNTSTLYRKKHHGSIIREIDNQKFKQILSYNPTTGIAKTTFDFGEEKIEEHYQKPYDKNVLTTLLKKNNFKVLSVFDVFKFNEPTDDAYKLLFITQKS